jgi:hypothetical protein
MTSETAQLSSTAAAPPPGRRRGVIGWVVVSIIVVLVTIYSVVITSRTPGLHDALDPASAGGTGTMALAQLLRAQGVDVTVVRSRAEVNRALTANSTLVFDNPSTLSDEAVLAMVANAPRTVAITATARLLRIFELGSDARLTTDPVTANCSWGPVARVGEIVPARLFNPAVGVTGCFTSAAGGAAVLIDERDDKFLALVEGASLFTNEYLAQRGNAALGLALLGQTDHVVWYVPSLSDSDLEWDPASSLGNLTPDWVTPAILLLLIAGIAAGIWRGRRFGPLVAETLPVTVRASETMHGRAHLTARSGDAEHAASALRDGTIRRIAKILSLSPRATAGQVADATADRLQLSRASLNDLLQQPLPTNDRDLVTYARQLGDLEDAIQLRVRNERSTQ